eukprot:CAMPEP_0174709876 /NCGR_PEP_ID=MMETSP1094-20130205/11684_1 /TAXON_ID=156173 /ORGANISM="Chrysochromulina brevifilum, Strain UTEX LB 985" /LENGTH=123 /DNA_ID=CAMNT_0015908597 /DNA_START=157 /DNA_END=529 /DNA_ORIENTATION=-
MVRSMHVLAAPNSHVGSYLVLTCDALCVTVHGTDCQWRNQACVLAHRLPVDLVRVVGKHVREEAATVLQKWARGASVRLGWDMPGLCELVVYGQRTNGCRSSFPILHSVKVNGLALDEMEEVD